MFLKNPFATFGGTFTRRFMFRKFYLRWTTVKNKMLNALIAQRVDAKALDKLQKCRYLPNRFIYIFYLPFFNLND